MCFQKAAEGGDFSASSAQWKLGVAHEDGDFGLESNAEEALKWNQMAADSGHFIAQRRLAEAYEGGDLRLGTDEKEALE